MFSEYFEDGKIKSEYCKEFISLWDGWLGKENYHKLDEVTEVEWSRFNKLLRSLAGAFTLEAVDFKKQSLTTISNIESLLSSYEEYISKDSSEFTKLVITDLGCVICEEWDYTYIIWHKYNGAVEALASYIKDADLEHFHD